MNCTRAEWPSFEINPSCSGSSGERSSLTCGNVLTVFTASEIAARKAGSSAVIVFDCSRTISVCFSMLSPCLSRVKPASEMIRSAVWDSPTWESVFEIVFVPIITPANSETMTNTSHRETAVFQWSALHCPTRAAKPLECLSGDIVCSFSALRL